MINKSITVSEVSKQELESLESTLKTHLENMKYIKDSGLRSDKGGPKYPFAYVTLEYGIKHLIMPTTPAVWVDATGQNKEGPFTLSLKMTLPEEVYDKITSSLDAPTIQAGLGQSYAGK